MEEVRAPEDIYGTKAHASVERQLAESLAVLEDNYVLPRSAGEHFGNPPGEQVQMSGSAACSVGRSV